MHRAGQRRGQGVVVLLRDRVVLVLVAADAAERQAEHRAADRHQHVVELVVADALDRLGGDLSRIRPGHEKAGGGRGRR